MPEIVMIYEIVDTTNEEIYFNLAFYTDKELALRDADETSPERWRTDYEIEDYAKLEVREYEIGWNPCEYKTIKTVEWEIVYDEAEDDNVWVIKD